jgi:hypothetical protein
MRHRKSRDRCLRLDSTCKNSRSRTIDRHDRCLSSLGSLPPCDKAHTDHTAAHSAVRQAALQAQLQGGSIAFTDAGRGGRLPRRSRPLAARRGGAAACAAADAACTRNSTCGSELGGRHASRGASPAAVCQVRVVESCGRGQPFRHALASTWQSGCAAGSRLWQMCTTEWRQLLPTCSTSPSA